MEQKLNFEFINVEDFKGELAELIAEEKVEFEAKPGADVREAAQRHLGHRGMMVCGSKSLYHKLKPKNMVVFNSNVCTAEDGKIWYGDIDITLSEGALAALASEIGKKVYVLYEMDARFDNEEKPNLDRAVFHTDGKVSASGSEYYVQKLRQIDGVKKKFWTSTIDR